jgi:hypothetical protein
VHLSGIAVEGNIATLAKCLSDGFFFHQFNSSDKLILNTEGAQYCFRSTTKFEFESMPNRIPSRASCCIERDYQF